MVYVGDRGGGGGGGEGSVNKSYFVNGGGGGGGGGKEGQGCRQKIIGESKDPSLAWERKTKN